LLEATASPRVVLVGGSSSPYATNCEYLSEKLGLTCINVGVTAYFGIDFYLSMLEKTMREGDVILIAPEWSMLGGTVSYTTMWMGIENHRAAWRMVPLKYWPRMVTSYAGYVEDKLNIYNRGVPPPAYPPEFGPLGDVTLERETLLERGRLGDEEIPLGPGVVKPQAVRALNRFYARAVKAGVRAYFAYAPVNGLAVNTGPEKWRDMDDYLNAALDMPVLGTQAEAVMESGYFYDSNNHLTTEGARLYSERLAALLRQALGAA
jgi:hypothetical protein